MQCVDKATKMCNIILNNITDVDECILVNLYKCYDRPLLDYACIYNIFTSSCISY